MTESENPTLSDLIGERQVYVTEFIAQRYPSTDFDEFDIGDWVNSVLDNANEYSRDLELVKHCMWLRGAAEALNLTINELLETR